MEERFWETKGLQQLSPAEWEALCDGCGRCCLHKLQDEETDEIFYTRVACKLLDLKSCRCRDYERRQALVSDCVVLGPDQTETLQWLPKSCAYRLLAEGKPLPPWHPLVSPRPNALRRRGKSACGFAISEEGLPHPEALQHYVIPWPD